MMAKSGAMTDCDMTDLLPSEIQDACDLQYSTLSRQKKNLTSEQESVQEKNLPIMVGPHPRMEFALTSMSPDGEEKNALMEDVMLDSGNQEGPDNKDVKISVSEEENELCQEKFSAEEDVRLPLSEDLSCCDENNEADNQSTTADGVGHSTGCGEQGEDKYLKNENRNLKPVIFSSSLGSLLSLDINCGTAEQRIEDGPPSLESVGFISCENSPGNSAMGSSVIKRPVDLNGSNESSKTGQSSAVSPLGSECYFSCEDSSLILDTVTIEENIEPENTESHTVDDQEISESKLPLNHYTSEEDEKLSADLNLTISKGLDLEKQQPCEDEKIELHDASLNDEDIEIKHFNEDEVMPLESESYSLGEDSFLDHEITIIGKETVNSENYNCTFEESEERLVYENKERPNSFVTHEEKMPNADVSHTLPCSQERLSLMLNTLIIDEQLEVNVASEFNSDFNRTESVKNENNEQIEEEEKPFSPDESINLTAENNFAINADESTPLDMENNVAVTADKSIPLDMENNFAINADESMPLCMESDVIINADESMSLCMESDIIINADESMPLDMEINVAINADESMPLDMESNVAINADESMPLDMENNVAINADESMPLCMENVAINADEGMPLCVENNVAINADESMPLDMGNNVAINADGSMPLCMGNNVAITVDKSIPLDMENNFAVSADKSMHLDMEYNFSINEDAQFVRTEENLHCCSSEEGISLRGEEESKIAECQLSDAASSDMNSSQSSDFSRDTCHANEEEETELQIPCVESETSSSGEDSLSDCELSDINDESVESDDSNCFEQKKDRELDERKVVSLEFHADCEDQAETCESDGSSSKLSDEAFKFHPELKDSCRQLDEQTSEEGTYLNANNIEDSIVNTVETTYEISLGSNVSVHGEVSSKDCQSVPTCANSQWITDYDLVGAETTSTENRESHLSNDQQLKERASPEQLGHLYLIETDGSVMHSENSNVIKDLDTSDKVPHSNSTAFATVEDSFINCENDNMEQKSSGGSDSALLEISHSIDSSVISVELCGNKGKDNLSDGAETGNLPCAVSVSQENASETGISLPTETESMQLEKQAAQLSANQKEIEQLGSSEHLEHPNCVPELSASPNAENFKTIEVSELPHEQTNLNSEALTSAEGPALNPEISESKEFNEMAENVTEYHFVCQESVECENTFVAENIANDGVSFMETGGNILESGKKGFPGICETAFQETKCQTSSGDSFSVVEKLQDLITIDNEASDQHEEDQVSLEKENAKHVTLNRDRASSCKNLEIVEDQKPPCGDDMQQNLNSTDFTSFTEALSRQGICADSDGNVRSNNTECQHLGFKPFKDAKLESSEVGVEQWGSNDKMRSEVRAELEKREEVLDVDESTCLPSLFNGRTSSKMSDVLEAKVGSELLSGCTGSENEPCNSGELSLKQDFAAQLGFLSSNSYKSNSGNTYALESKGEESLTKCDMDSYAVGQESALAPFPSVFPVSGGKECVLSTEVLEADKENFIYHSDFASSEALSYNTEEENIEREFNAHRLNEIDLEVVVDKSHADFNSTEYSLPYKVDSTELVRSQGATVESYGSNEEGDNLTLRDKLLSEQVEHKFTPASGPENISAVYETDVNDPELQKSADRVDFVRDPVSRYEHVVTADPSEGRMTDRSRVSDHGMLQTDKTDRSFIGKSNYEQILDAEPFAEGQQKLRYFPELDASSCGEVMDSETRDPFGNSDSYLEVSETVELKEESSAETVQDMGNKLTCNEISPQKWNSLQFVSSKYDILSETSTSVAAGIEGQKEKYLNMSFNTGKNFQSADLPCGKQKPIDWEWKIKVLEEGKNKLAEQNKELHSQLQLHLENESSMSLQLDVLSNKLTVAEGERCVLQDENQSLISDCEKMQTGTEYLLLKHREELEVLRAKCLKEKQEEVAHLEDQLEQTLQQHDSVLRELELKFKVLEEEKNELAEQKKELHSQLQSHLENDSSVSLELLVLSNKLTVTEGEMCLLQNENHSLISDLEKMKTDMDHVLQKHREELEVLRAKCLKEKQEEVAHLEDQLEQTFQQHDSVLRELEGKQREAATASEVMILLREENESVNRNLAISEEKIASLNSTLQERAAAYEKLFGENKSLKDAAEHEQSRNTQLVVQCDLLQYLIAEKDVIATELKDNVVAFEKVITSQSCEIEELQKTLDAKEELCREESVVTSELQQTVNQMNFERNYLLESLQRIVCCHQKTLSNEDQDHPDLKVLHSDIERFTENIEQLVETLSAIDITSDDKVTEVIKDVNMYIKLVQECLYLKKRLLCALQADWNAKNAELSEMRTLLVAKDTECNVLNERLIHSNLAFRKQGQKLEDIEEELLSKTSQLQGKNDEIGTLRSELLSTSTGFRFDVENLNVDKEILSEKLENSLRDVANLHEEKNGLNVCLVKTRLLFEQKSNVLLSAEKKVFETEGKLKEKETALKEVEEDCQDNKMMVQNLHEELVKVSQVLKQFCDEILINPDGFSLEDNKRSSQNSASPFENELIVKHTSVEMEKQEFFHGGLEHQVVRDTSSGITSLTTVTDNMLQDDENHGFEKNLSTAIESLSTVKQLYNDLKAENMNLKSSVSNNREAFLNIGNQLKTIENLISPCDQNVTNEPYDNLLLRLQHIVNALQYVNVTNLPKFVQPVFAEIEVAINEIFTCHGKEISHSTICEKVKCVSQMLFELQEEINIRETQYSELCSHLGRIETEISGNLGGDNSASVANRVERLIEQIQLRRTLNEQVSYMLSECEKNKASLQTLCDITVMLQEKLQVDVCESDLAETVRYLLDTKDQVEDKVTLAKSDLKSCAEHVECLQNQIKHLEDTNSELKTDFESCKRTLCDVRQQEDALERSLGEKLTALSAEMSTVLTETAEWKSKYQASEKLVANYEEQVASLRKVKSQLNATIEEVEEDLQKTYEESKELKIKISNVVGETEKVRKAMCVDCEDPECFEDLMLQYRKVVNFFKMKNDNISEQVKVAEQKFLEVCREKETMAVVISDLGEEVKSLQVSLQEKDEEVKGLISELATTNHFLSELKSEFDCAQTQLSGTVEETSEKLNKACLEKEMLSGENKKLLSEIEMLKQVQLVKCKKEADDQEVLAAKVKTLNGELEALKQKLHEQSTEISELKFQREELLKDFDQSRRKNKVLESKDEEYSKMSETNKCLNDLVKELKKQVIEIEDENFSVFEKLDVVEKAKAEMEEEWISKYRTCSHRIESLCKKISQINNVLLASSTDKHHLCDDKQSGCSISEVEGKNAMHSTSDRDSNQMASWNSLCDHFELLNAKFAEFSGSVEVAAQRKEAVEKNSAADYDLERCRQDIDDWRNVYKKVESFISDVMTEMNFPISLLKSIRGDDHVLNPKGCEDSLMRNLHQIKEHLRHACKENLHLKSRMERFEKLLSELRAERRKISEEYDAEKKKNRDGTSQVFLSTVKIEKLTQDVKCLEKANCRLEEEACALRMKVCNLKQREVDFHQKDNELSRKLKILSSEINDLLDNNKHLKQENQALVKEVNAKKKCDRETELRSNIASLRLKVAEYESEITQLKAERQQTQALQCMDSSDMTVNLPLLRLFPNPAASSMGTTCDNFTDEIKNNIAAILQILCIGNLSSPPGKQIQLIKDKVTSLLKNSSDNLQLARQICKEVLSESPALVGKSLSGLLHILGSKLKERRGEVSVINRNICNHVQSLSCFIRVVCECFQLSKSESSSCTAAIAKIFEQLHAIEQTDISHLHKSLSSVDRTLQNDVLPLLRALRDQASRDADSSVQKLLIQEMQKVSKYEAEIQVLKKAKEKYEVSLQFKTFEEKRLQKICEDLRQELADKNAKENKNPLKSFVQKTPHDKSVVLEKRPQCHQESLNEAVGNFSSSIKKTPKHFAEQQQSWENVRIHQQEENSKEVINKDLPTKVAEKGSSISSGNLCFAEDSSSCSSDYSDAKESRIFSKSLVSKDKELGCSQKSVQEKSRQLREPKKVAQPLQKNPPP